MKFYHTEEKQQAPKYTTSASCYTESHNISLLDFGSLLAGLQRWELATGNFGASKLQYIVSCAVYFLYSILNSAFSCPAISCVALSPLAISMVRHFHVLHFSVASAKGMS